MGNGGYSQKLARPEREADHSPASSAEVIMRGAILSLPQ
jgi:hypothetical protein